MSDQGVKKVLWRTKGLLENVSRIEKLSLERRLLCATNRRAKTLLELVDATFCVNKCRLTCVERVSVSSDAH